MIASSIRPFRVLGKDSLFKTSRISNADIKAVLAACPDGYELNSCGIFPLGKWKNEMVFKKDKGGGA